MTNDATSTIPAQSSHHCVSLPTLRKRKDELDNALDALDAKRAAEGLSADEETHYASINTDWESVTDQILDMEDALLTKPLRSRRGVAIKLNIIADRFDTSLAINEQIVKAQIQIIAAQIREWLRNESVCWPTPQRNP